ncbi:hypothetical protein E0H77_03535 [Acinetobacter sp. ANC 4633]|uniref:hypothetical protein n=1 Tax=Acinetobacter sp. ANC 4633 TaxID=2529845 RepID=UPI00103D2E19|nr:hypothetical protein [Acinetobacter sp. ANC 4633]TCB27770.1 hypothetical protein E0H77_03535 [Acinetobacter sp. ANC 4633]
MKLYLRVAAYIGLSTFFSACNSNPPATLALQKENNEFEVTGLGKTAVIAKNNAIIAAKKTCSQQTAIIRSENTSYHGLFKNVTDEQTGQSVATAAEILGGILGHSSNLQRDDDYQTTLTFYCQAK